MTYQDAGKFRNCWMFDTHEAAYYLDDNNGIVGIYCSKIRDEVLGVQSGTRVEGYIGNPGVYALENAESSEIRGMLQELTTTYSYKIEKWLKANKKQQIGA